MVVVSLVVVEELGKSFVDGFALLLHCVLMLVYGMERHRFLMCLLWDLLFM